MDGDALRKRNIAHSKDKKPLRINTDEYVSDLFGRNVNVPQKSSYKYEYPKNGEGFYGDMPIGSDKWGDKEWDEYLDYQFPENGNDWFNPATLDNLEKDDGGLDYAAKRAWNVIPDKYEDSSDIELADDNWLNYYNRLANLYAKRGGDKKRYPINDYPAHLI